MRRPLPLRLLPLRPPGPALLLVLGLGLAPLLAGCGDDEEGADSGSSGQATAQATATVTATVTAAGETPETSPPPEGPTGQDAVDFFRSTEADCAAFATSVGNDVLPGYLFTEASAARDLGEGSWVVLDGAGTELVVDLTAGVVHGLDGPTGVLPIDYSFGCPETLYLGSAGD